MAKRRRTYASRIEDYMPERERMDGSIGERVTTLEIGFKQIVQQNTRIESKLDDLARVQITASTVNDDRVEKIVTTAIAPLKEQSGKQETKIEGLQSDRKFNLITTCVVVSALFGMVTWFNTQNTNTISQLVTSNGNVMRLEFARDVDGVNNRQTAIESRLGSIEKKQDADEHAEVDKDKSYQEFRGTTLAQNNTSIQERKDQAEALRQMISAQTETAKALASFISETHAKSTEIETQFRLGDQLRNVQFSDQQRKNSEYQNTLHDLGGKIPQYPTGPFFQPNVSKQSSVNGD